MRRAPAHAAALGLRGVAGAHRAADHDLGQAQALQLGAQGREKALVQALYAKGELKLDYDTELTRNAAEAFAARSGNCLSLVIMTGAFANAMNLKVTYQQVATEDMWSRSGDM